MLQIATGIDGLFLQFVPCQILVVSTALILIKIRKSKKRKTKLKITNSNARSNNTTNEDQTSNTLLAIVILFLICELPMACLIFAGLFDVRVLFFVTRRLYLLARTIRLINASLNFILYCSMSQLFRETFKETFKPLISIIRTRTHSQEVSCQEMSELQTRSETTNSQLV